MSEDIFFEEEEFTTQFNGETIKRIAKQAAPYKLWVAGFLFLIALVSFQDSLFTYISKLIIDEGIIPGDRERLIQLFIIYSSLILVQAGLGAWTIWSNKAADVATAHVVVGALSLVTGALASIITLRRFYPSGAAIPAGASFEAVRAGFLNSPPANP